MGIIRIIFIFCLTSQCLFSQTIRDTVKFGGKIYVEHIVKEGESLKIIAQMHSVDVSEILNSNEMQRNLYYNQLLYIPIHTESHMSGKKNKNKIFNINKNVEFSSDEIKIALLMPYYITRNDTMFNDFKDTTEINSLYYKSSEVALSFHVGVNLALDSLRKIGVKAVLYTFDTNNDTIKTKAIIDSGALDDMDIIIGPLHVKNFNILCREYGNNKDKIIINPLSRITNNVESYKSVYQISARVEDQLLIIQDYIISKYKNKRILILYQDIDRGSAVALKRMFMNSKLDILSYNVQYTHVDSIRHIFSPFQIVVVPSVDKAFVSKLLSSIRCMDSTSVVFGLNSWINYDNLDIDDLMEINLHLPLSNPLDYNIKHSFEFLNLFESEYNTNHRKYTFNGYNIIMHFLGGGKIFSFKKIMNGGRVNIKLPMYYYSNYDLVPAK